MLVSPQAQSESEEGRTRVARFQLTRPASIAETEPTARIEHWLTNRGYVMHGVDIDGDALLIDSDRDPSGDLAEYASQPTPVELARLALRNDLQDIRAIPQAQRTPEQRAWLAWAIIQRFD